MYTCLVLRQASDHERLGELVHLHALHLLLHRRALHRRDRRTDLDLEGLAGCDARRDDERDQAGRRLQGDLLAGDAALGAGDRERRSERCLDGGDRAVAGAGGGDLAGFLAERARVREGVDAAVLDARALDAELAPRVAAAPEAEAAGAVLFEFA